MVVMVGSRTMGLSTKVFPTEVSYACRGELEWPAMISVDVSETDIDGMWLVRASSKQASINLG